MDLVDRWNDTGRPYPDVPLHELFEARMSRWPAAIAVRDGATVLSYQELNDLAHNLAVELQRRGVRRGDRVGLLMPRSAGALVGILGILKSGACYVPFPVDAPDARIQHMADWAGVELVVSTVDQRDPTGRASVFIDIDRRERVADQLRPPEVTSTDLAYVIYTSGSTGVPKAVAVPHRAVTRLLADPDWCTYQPTDVALATFSPSFDLSVMETWGILFHGGRLVVASKETLLAPVDFADLLAREDINVVNVAAAVFHQMVRHDPAMFARQRLVLVGADAMSPTCARAVLAAGPPEHLLDVYGPTENGMICVVHDVRDLPADADTVPIGQPVCNCTAYVLREDGSLAGIGEEGELYVGGDGLADGYWRDPERTADVFVPHPFDTTPGARLYRTGDRARWRADGVIEFLGRRDRQVQIRGYRVELGEVEVSLRAHPDVREVVAAATRGADEELSLVAWVVPKVRYDRAAGVSAAQGMRRWVRDRLPTFMVPARVVLVDRLPLNASGKVDRRALAELAATTANEVTDAPRGELETTIADIWAELLGCAAVGRQDDFFALGGQSLQASQITAAVRDRLGVQPKHGRLLLRALLANATLSAFARTVADVLASGDEVSSKEPVIDFRREATLAPDIQFTVPASGGQLEQILLTGATGFLGAFLLRTLLDKTTTSVQCLVRAADPQQALYRISANQRRFGLPELTEADRSRIVAVPADLSKPRLGLDEDAYARLGRGIDVILHNGAHVNFLYPYSSTRDTNIGGLLTLMELAGTHHLKPLHYLSTMTVIAGFGANGVRYVTEDQPLKFPEALSMGYPQSKWVGEQLLRQAAERGLPMSIYRTYEITGDTQYGVWNTDTMFCALFKAIAETGVAPDVGLPLDLVPVDFTARAIVHMVTEHGAHGEVFHVSNPDGTARLRLLVDRLRAMGYPVEKVSYGEWVSRMMAYTAADPTYPLASYMPIFADNANTDTDVAVKELYFDDLFPYFSRINMEKATAGADLYCPRVDGNLIDLYLNRMRADGFIAPPPERIGSAEA
jgi:amino acid adenylation domain-containing protein/thioester reductase-like protein